MTNNIFGGGDEKLQSEFKEKVDTQTKALLGMVQRQKDLESSIDLLDEKIELLDHNSIKNFKKVNQDMKNIKSDLRELKSEIEIIKEFNDKVKKQLKLMSTRDEVAKLEKYIDLWNPMNFITREELEEFHQKVKDDLQNIVEEFLKK